MISRAKTPDEKLEQDARDIAMLTLLLESRQNLAPAFAWFLEASTHVEQWLEDGAKTDPETVRATGPHVYDALVALSVISTAARRVTKAAARASAGLEPEQLN